MSNRFSRMVKKVSVLPPSFHPLLLTKLFCSQVKFAGTAGVKIHQVTSNKVFAKLANKKKVQNHIGGIHAVAAALLAESTTGIVFAMNVQDGCLPLLKSMKIDYQRRMKGDLTAIARLTDEQQKLITENDKGDIVVDVVISDESNEQPIHCQMEWAWVSKNK